MEPTTLLRTTLVVPGGVEVAAVADVAHARGASKHAAVGDDVEDGMVATMQEMRIGTVERNAEFLAQVEAIRARQEAAARQCAGEVAARDAMFAAVRRALEAALADLDAGLAAGVQDTFTRAASALPPIAAGMAALQAAEGAFYGREVPATVEALSAAATREVAAHKEVLAFDSATIAEREAAFSDRLEKHAASFHRRCSIEAADRAAQHARLLAQFDDSMATIDAGAAFSRPRISAGLKEVTDALAAEAAARVATDAASLQTAEAVFARLQREALETFGEEGAAESGAGTAAGEHS